MMREKAKEKGTMTTKTAEPTKPTTTTTKPTTTTTKPTTTTTTKPTTTTTTKPTTTPTSIISLPTIPYDTLGSIEQRSFCNNISTTIIRIIMTIVTITTRRNDQPTVNPEQGGNDLVLDSKSELSLYDTLNAFITVTSGPTLPWYIPFMVLDLVPDTAIVDVGVRLCLKTNSMGNTKRDQDQDQTKQINAATQHNDLLRCIHFSFGDRQGYRSAYSLEMIYTPQTDELKFNGPMRTCDGEPMFTITKIAENTFVLDGNGGGGDE